MPISLLKIDNFRNLSNIELDAQPIGLNIISGMNGSGKTSILEAIYYLGHGRSFRTSESTRLISHQSEKFSIFTKLLNEGSVQIAAGTERYLDGSAQSRLLDKNINNISSIAQLIPIRVINSQSHELFEGGPAFRRKYLDWGLFYHHESFLNTWRSYERALKQRNRLLKEKRYKNEIDAWTEELAKHGNELNVLRKSYLDLLLPELAKLTQILLGIASTEITYYPGWDSLDSFESALEKSFPEEHRFGTTQLGPHRADFEVILEGVAAKYYLSRGQQKLLICAMILAQGRVMSAMTNKALTYLVDDLPAELDSDSRQKLISLLLSQQTQVFITAIESSLICECIDNESATPMNLFHVEHGNVIGA